ncbi:MAG: UDP-N-acetylglucosamine 2-epimerase (non-hydrolyzing) [Pirellulales bacterium]|nr:UDP-N-acetylglucosamine 2-epimerase (non-hydrolyzing) [Pirellulales bacterium]
MKMAPILRAFDQGPFRGQLQATLIHTGQHYDASLSDVFFEELGMRRPDISLDVGSASHGVQTARVLERMEKVLIEGTPEGVPFDRLIVVGDVNSTMAATLAAVKLGVPVAHVEAGLRSFDRTMPEEINRIVTDSLADMLLVSEPAGLANLRKEGHPEEHLHLVGNVMIDTLFHMLPKATKINAPSRFGVAPGEYGVVTLHRPSNVDDPDTLTPLIDVLIDISAQIPLIFPIHPRTRERLERFGLQKRLATTIGLTITPPLGYLDFLSLTTRARVIVTDSGGLQEESTVLGIPCLTMRPNTERPITVTQGTSTLIGNDPIKLRHHLHEVASNTYKRGHAPAEWDGHAADRIATVIAGGTLNY